VVSLFTRRVGSNVMGRIERGSGTRDLLFDSEGSLKFKTDLWNDIRSVIVPTLVDKSATLPFLASSTSMTPLIWSSRILLYSDVTLSRMPW